MIETSLCRAVDGVGFVQLRHDFGCRSWTVALDLAPKPRSVASTLLTSPERRALARRSRKRRNSIPVREYRPMPRSFRTVTLHRRDFVDRHEQRWSVFLANGDALTELDRRALAAQVGPSANTEGRGWYFVIEREQQGLLCTPSIQASCRYEVIRRFEDSAIFAIGERHDTEEQSYEAFRAFIQRVAPIGGTRYTTAWLDAQNAANAARSAVSR